VREVRVEHAVRGDSREYRLRLLEIAVHRVTEHRVAVPRLVARLRAGLRPGRLEIHEPVGTRDGQGPQQHLVEEGEDGCIRADAERQRDDCNGGDEGRLEESPQGELDVHVGALDGNTRRGLPGRPEGLRYGCRRQ
jgi:hypothetical protein